MSDIFDPQYLQTSIQRIEQIQPDTKPLWGKMNATEMLAHCSLVFEYNNGQRQAKVNPVLRFFLAGMMRKAIVGPKPYKRNSPTAPYFRVNSVEEHNKEKARLIENLKSFHTDGPAAAEAREHAWLGKMSSADWSRAMCKHLDHHLDQFNV